MVIAIIGILVLLLLPAVQAARASARAAYCKNNMRQIGLAFLQHVDLHGGEFPQIAHRENAQQSWIYVLAPFLEGVDEMRICPDDPKGTLRLQANSTSYVLNDYIGSTVKGSVRKLNKLREPSKTLVMFEGSDQRSTDFSNEHAHASEWFSAVNQRMGLVGWNIERDIQIRRHFDSAHYLYADAHLGVIDASQVQAWIAANYNFALPNPPPYKAVTP